MKFPDCHLAPARATRKARHPGQSLMHSLDDRRARIERIERGPLDAFVFLGREQSAQFLADRLPGGILVGSFDRVWEDGQLPPARSPRSGREDLAARPAWRPVAPARPASGCGSGKDVAGLGLLAAGRGGGDVDRGLGKWNGRYAKFGFRFCGLLE